MEKNTNDNHFSESIFIIPVDDNYYINKHTSSLLNKPSFQLTSNNIFIDNYSHMIRSYLHYYKTYYINQIQIKTKTNILSTNKQTLHRRYTYSPSFSKRIFK